MLASLFQRLKTVEFKVFLALRLRAPQCPKVQAGVDSAPEGSLDMIPLRGVSLSSLAIQVFLSGNFDDKRDISLTVKNYTHFRRPAPQKLGVKQIKLKPSTYINKTKY